MSHNLCGVLEPEVPQAADLSQSEAENSGFISRLKWPQELPCEVWVSLGGGDSGEGKSSELPRTLERSQTSRVSDLSLLTSFSS